MKRNEIDAVKVMHLKEVEEKGLGKRYLVREVTALIAVRHPNVLRVYDIFRSGGQLYIFMEFASNGTLKAKVKAASGGYLSDKQTRHWFKQCCEALHCMHTVHRMAHRDIKLENVLLDGADNAKLSDFGFAREYNVDMDKLSTTYCGTEPYFAPEIIDKRPYNPFLYDVWSMGIMLFAMLNGTVPFDVHDLKSTRKSILKQMEERRYKYNPSAESGISAEAKDLVARMLTYSQEKRPNITEVLKHPFLRE